MVPGVKSKPAPEIVTPPPSFPVASMNAEEATRSEESSSG